MVQSRESKINVETHFPHKIFFYYVNLRKTELTVALC